MPIADAAPRVIRKIKYNVDPQRLEQKNIIAQLIRRKVFAITDAGRTRVQIFFGTQHQNKTDLDSPEHDACNIAKLPLEYRD